MGKKKDNILVKIGTIINKATQKSYKTLRAALDDDSKCGCGINCCKKEAYLPDKTNGGIGTIFFDDDKFKVILPNGEEKVVSFEAEEGGGV